MDRSQMTDGEMAPYLTAGKKPDDWITPAEQRMHRIEKAAIEASVAADLVYAGALAAGPETWPLAYIAALEIRDAFISNALGG